MLPLKAFYFHFSHISIRRETTNVQIIYVIIICVLQTIIIIIKCGSHFALKWIFFYIQTAFTNFIKQRLRNRNIDYTNEQPTHVYIAQFHRFFVCALSLFSWSHLRSRSILTAHCVHLENCFHIVTGQVRHTIRVNIGKHV